MSAATSSNWPQTGRATEGHSIGSIKGSASQRNRQGSGSTATSAASSPHSTAQGSAAAADHTASGRAASHCRKTLKPWTSADASNHSGGINTPSKASGVTAKVTSGMATMLATKPTSEICWKNSRLKGARPTVATACVRSAPAMVCQARSRHPSGNAARADTGSEATSSATATNDNQKPGCSSAQGSSIVTASAAPSSTACKGQRAPVLRNSTTMPIIHTVRCAGTPQPASIEYPAAAAQPPHSPARCAGSHSGRRGCSRHSRDTRAPASQANIVTCSPEMLIRWATPVMRNRSQPSRSMAAWSPMASAASTPAAAGSATRTRIASRIDWRHRSTGWPAFSVSFTAGACTVERTVPLAAMPCSNNHSSRSKPCGLSVPCGARRRTVMRQR